jgi:hypothetical protein
MPHQLVGSWLIDEKQLTTAQLLLDWFSGREDTIAIDKGGGFNPLPLERPLTPKKFAVSHLSGETCIGFYVIRSDDRVKCTCLDFDNHNNDRPLAFAYACRAYMELFNLGFTPLIEVSQSGSGAHVWLCFDQPVPARLTVRFWKEFIRRFELPGGTEIYPRQESLAGMTLGNLIRYPLFNQSRFVLFSQYDETTGKVDWITQDPIAILTDGRVKKTTIEQLENACGWWSIDPNESEESCEVLSEDGITPRVRQLLLDNAGGLIGRRWAGDITGLRDPSNSALIMSMTTEMVRAFIPTPDIEMALRYWSEKHHYEKGLREDFIRRTLARAYDMAVSRKEKRSLTGDTVPAIAHQYADAIYNGDYTLIPTGISAMDASFGGFANSELIVLSGRPNHCKTALGIQFMENAALLNYPTLMVSLEMSKQAYSRRVLLRVSETPEEHWTSAEANNRIHQRIDTYFASRANMYFADGARHIDRIEQVIEQYVNDHGVKFVVVDYMGLVGSDEATEYAKQTEIVNRLKESANTHDIPIVSICMMRRDAEKEPDRPPRIEG